MTRAVATLLTMCAVAGCVPHQIGFFERDPADQSTFVYRVLADPDFPISERDLRAETSRLEWIGYYVDANELCKTGYSVVSRDAYRNSTSLRTNGNIVYRIRCKP